MATAASIEIALEAQTASLKKGMAEGRKAIDNLGKGMSGSVATGLAKFHAGLMLVKGGLAAVQGAIQGVMAAMAGIDTTEKFAARIGVAGDQLRILNFAAEQTGASAETMNMGLQRMTRRISEAAQGSGEAQGALQELGLSAEYLATLSPDKQFGALADAMEGVTNQGDRVRLAMKLFDSEGVALVNTLKGGSAALNAYGSEAESLGMLLGDTGGKVEAANDAINRMKKAWGGLIEKVAVLVAPALEAIANVLSKIVGAFSRLFNLGGESTSFGGHMKRAAEAFVPPAEKALDKLTDKFAEKAKDLTKAAKKELVEIARIETPGIGAVTRRSAAGYSAVQEARREQADRERQHQEMLRVLVDILTEIRLTGSTNREVRILT